MEKYKFFNYNFKDPVHFKKLRFDPNRLVASKLVDAVTRNLSSVGITFTSPRMPELSSVVLLDISALEPAVPHEISGGALTLHNKLLGKVVRIEHVSERLYRVGVALVAKSETITKEISYLIECMNLRRSTKLLTTTATIILVVVAAFSVNISYFQRKLTYNPEKRMYITPQAVGLLYEEAAFNTEDGQTIRGWYVPCPGAKITILSCHGKSGNICDQLSKLKFFHGMGFNFLTFDYRGYGASSGTPSEEGLYKDAQAAYDYLASRPDVNKDMIIVLGESLGGAVATDLCTKRDVRALVLESTFVSLGAQAKDLYPLYPVEHLLTEKFDSASKIQSIHVPKLIVHGTDDEVIPFSHGQDLFEKAPGPKKFIPFRGSHDDNLFKVSNTYRLKLAEFLGENNIL